MIRIEKQVHGIKMINTWFADEAQKEPGIIIYKEATVKIGKAVPFDTLISDISGTDDEIKAVFSKGCKYKVNRALREDVDFCIYDSSQITDEMLETFLDFFEEFWKSKGTSLENRASLTEEMKQYRTLNALTMAYAVVAGEIAVYHTHVYDGKTARLLHSASLFRLQSDEEDKNKNLIGMANRALHYKEMLYFRDKGLTVYDWGGAGKGEDVASITEFKESFGGEHVTYYDCIANNGFRAKLTGLLSDMKHIFIG